MNFMMDTSLYDVRRWDSIAGKWIYDKPTDWEKAKTIGITCAAVKSSEAMYEDEGFRIQWKAAQGRPRVAWHFFRADVNAIAQAQKFLSIVQDDWNPTNDIAALDWETFDGQDNLTIQRAGGSFLYEVEKMLGRCGIYTYPNYWQKIGGEASTWAKKYPLLMAQWPLDNWVFNFRLPPFVFHLDDIQNKLMIPITNGTLTPVSLLPWGTDIMNWQFTARAWSADIPGHAAIKTLVDLNAVLKPWWNTSPAPIPAPVLTQEQRITKLEQAARDHGWNI